MTAEAPAFTADSLTLTRYFEAPRELVWAAWTDPQHIRAWSAPHGFSIPHCEGDLRVGGAWRATMVAPDGAEHRLAGVYREIVPPARLVFSHAWLDAEGRAGPETLVTVTLAEEGRGTRLTLVQSGFASASARDGHADGWSQCLERLAGYLSAMA